MGFVYVPLMPVSAVPTTVDAIYINPEFTKSFVSSIELHNTLSATAIVNVYLVPDNAGTLGDALSSNEIWRVTLAGYETVLLEPKFAYILADQNDAIFADADIEGVNILCKGSLYL